MAGRAGEKGRGQSRRGREMGVRRVTCGGPRAGLPMTERRDTASQREQVRGSPAN